jgi:HSP20 family protein
MSVSRWNPFQDLVSLRETMDRIFHDTLASSQGMIPLDIAEDDTQFTVHASLPGFKPDDIQIQIDGNRLTIRAEHQEEPQQEQPQGQTTQQNAPQSAPNAANRQWIVRERHSSSVYRVVTLPAQVNADQAQAQFEQGVLTLTLPRAQSAQPKQIRIANTANQASTPDMIAVGQSTTPSSAGQATTNTNGTPATGAQPSSPQADVRAAASATRGGDAQAGMTTDAQQEAGEESFPASDPPSTSTASPSA